MKPRKCTHCKTEFLPSRMGQKVCSPECAYQIARNKREKIERAADQQKRESLKTRSDWIKDAQIAFNAFIRARDTGKPCITCGAPWGSGNVGGSFDCGHYRSTGTAPHLRFTEHNAAGQCKKCNRYLAGRAVDYRIELAKRIGLEAVESLEADQSTPKWTIDDLKAIRDTYRAKLKELKNGAS